MNSYIFSSNLDKLFYAIDARNYSPEIIYPNKKNLFKDDILRGKNCDSPKAFLERILSNKDYNDYIYNSRISENMLLFLYITLDEDRKTINYANIQAFIVEEVTLEEIAVTLDCEENISDYKVFYYRVDYDRNNLGRIFKESLPHLHILPKGDPRFNLYDIKDNIILDFLDLIYRNHFYDEWLNWVKGIMPDGDYAQFIENIDSDYKNNLYFDLTNGKEQFISKIKQIIVDYKHKGVNLRIDTSKDRLLNYSYLS